MTDGHDSLAPPPLAAPLMDLVRVAATLGVVAIHGALSWGGQNAYLLRPQVLMTVFFELSACLLGLPFILAALGKGPAIPARRFWARRARRLYPPYLAALVIAAIMSDSARATFAEPVHFLLFLLLAQNTTSETAFQGLPQAWTLPIEAQFYLALPAIGALLAVLVRARGRSSLPVALLACAVTGSAVRFAITAAEDPNHYVRGASYVWVSILTRGDVLAWGLLAAWCVATSTALKPAWWGVSVLVAAGGLAVPATGNLSLGLHESATGPIVCLALVSLARCGERSGPFWRGMRSLSGASYSIYLYHMMVLDKVVNGSVVWILALPILVLASAWLLERPFQGSRPQRQPTCAVDLSTSKRRGLDEVNLE